MNYKFHIDEWLPMFPLKEEYERYSGCHITSPFHICNNEQLRRELGEQLDWGEAVPVDIFVMSEGEPSDRACTKIGGLPYRPTGLPWPSKDDEPMLFLAQFNFADSKDIVGPLPGELPLIFGDDSGGPFDPLHFEWWNKELSDLIDASEIPEHPSSFVPCFGHLHRTMSYPKAKWKVSGRYPVVRGCEVWSRHLLPQYQANQIGCAPCFIQEGDEEMPGKVICTINSIGPMHDQPFPWINRPEPIPLEHFLRPDREHFGFADSGCIYISIDGSQKLHWRASSY